MWRAIFKQLNVEILFSTAYHPQTDGQSERSNQTAEIALRYYIAALDDDRQWPTVLPYMQSALNNTINASTRQAPNMVLYRFRTSEPADLMAATTDSYSRPDVPGYRPARIDAQDMISMASIIMKRTYDRRHKPIFYKPDDWVYLRLHQGYNVPSIQHPKISPQFAGPVRVIEQVGRLAYKLDLPPLWQIHPVVSIAHLEPAPSQHLDPYGRATEPPEPTAESYSRELR